MSTDKIEDIKDNDNRKWRTYSVKRSPNRVHYTGNDLPFVFVFFVAELSAEVKRFQFQSKQEIFHCSP